MLGLQHLQAKLSTERRNDSSLGARNWGLCALLSPGAKICVPLHRPLTSPGLCNQDDGPAASWPRGMLSGLVSHEGAKLPFFPSTLGANKVTALLCA